MKQLLAMFVGVDTVFLDTGNIDILSRLFRARLASLVALSALSGFLFAARSFSTNALLITLAVWLLAAGCSALNQLQEIKTDSLMQRTSARPLPTGELSVAQALLIASVAIGTGLLLLLLVGKTPLLLGLLATFWYNGIYTPLKKITAWAVFPGAICGALPPLIGYSAAGASILELNAVVLAGTLLIWQVPHFWLLAWRYRQDQLNSGLPTPLQASERKTAIRYQQLLARRTGTKLSALRSFRHDHQSDPG